MLYVAYNSLYRSSYHKDRNLELGRYPFHITINVFSIAMAPYIALQNATHFDSNPPTRL